VVSQKIVRDRLKRIQYLQDLRKAHPDWSEEKLVAMLSVETGVKPYTVQTYINLLKEAGKW
jgi:hypothetical protein